MNPDRGVAKAIRHQTAFDQPSHANGGDTNRPIQCVIGIVFGVCIRQHFAKMLNYSAALLCKLALPGIGLPIGRAYASQFANFLDSSLYVFFRYHDFHPLIHLTLPSPPACSRRANERPGRHRELAPRTVVLIPTARNCDSLGIPKSVKL